jgi:hypothetical protein
VAKSFMIVKALPNVDIGGLPADCGIVLITWGEE